LIEVQPRGNESFLQTLKRFSKLINQSGLNREIKQRQAYEKPSERIKRKRRESIRKLRKKLAKKKKENIKKQYRGH